MTPSIGAGFKVTHTPHLQSGRRADERTGVNPELTFGGCWAEKTVFSGHFLDAGRETRGFRGRSIRFNEDEQGQ
jgi:hypothetical protein